MAGTLFGFEFELLSFLRIKLVHRGFFWYQNVCILPLVLTQREENLD
jgi:hypothetical protein